MQKQTKQFAWAVVWIASSSVAQQKALLANRFPNDELPEQLVALAADPADAAAQNGLAEAGARAWPFLVGWLCRQESAVDGAAFGVPAPEQRRLAPVLQALSARRPHLRDVCTKLLGRLERLPERAEPPRLPGESPRALRDVLREGGIDRVWPAAQMLLEYGELEVVAAMPILMSRYVERRAERPRLAAVLHAIRLHAATGSLIGSASWSRVPSEARRAWATLGMGGASRAPVVALLKAASRDSEFVRACVALGFGFELQSESRVTATLDMMATDDDPFVRAAAVAAAAYRKTAMDALFASERVGLLQALDDPNRRLTAVHSLAGRPQLLNAEVVRRLLALHETEAGARSIIQSVLSRASGVDGELARSIEGGGELARSALNCMRFRRAPVASELALAVVRATRSSDAEAAKRAQETLENGDPADYMPAFGELLGSDRWFDALELLAGRLSMRPKWIDSSTPHLQRIAEHVEKGDRARELVFRILGVQSWRRSERSTQPALKILLGLAGHEDVSVRRTALTSLQRWGRDLEEHIERVRPRLDDADDGVVRAAAYCFAVAEVRDEAAARRLFAEMQSDAGGPRQQAAAARSFGAVVPLDSELLERLDTLAEAGDRLAIQVRFLATPDDEACASRVARALVDGDDGGRLFGEIVRSGHAERFRGELLAALDSGAAESRRVMLTNLSWLGAGAKSMLPALRERLSRTDYKNLKDALRSAIRRIESDR